MSWDAKLFERYLTTRRFGREFRWFAELDSTNRWLAENQADFTMSGAMVIADHQTQGRGRRDRTWYDVGEASLLFTVLLRHPADDATLGFLSLTPAIAVANVLQKQVDGAAVISLKWPNDVLIDGRKVCGILGQSSVHGMQCTSVVGVGLNVTTARDDLPATFRERSTSLREITPAVAPREVLLAEILNQWEWLFDDLLNRRFDDLRAKWEALGPAKGTAITRQESGESLSGFFEGLGSHGQLLLRDEQGTLHELFTGDLS